jgi:cytochrome c-type biogenesis protein CcmH
VLKLWIGAALAALSLNALAVDAPPAAQDPVLERRVMEISEELRCLVCQNQTIADSHAELAVDLRNQVREMLQKGMSEQAIKDYMVARYGDFVLYRPPVKTTTWLLWAGPFFLLIGGLIILLIKLRQRARRIGAVQPEFSAAEKARLEKLLAGNGKDKS